MSVKDHQYANFIENNRSNITWKPLPDNFDTRCSHILERCQNTDTRLRTMTVPDVLAEIGRAVQSNWHEKERSFQFNHNVSHVLEDTTFDETFDCHNGSTVFSPGGTFTISTENNEMGWCPRTSSPVESDSPKYTEEQKREIWRRRVMLKNPILFNCSNQRHPKKSYKYQHRQIQRRRVAKIDDPWCRTPTPTALKTSWTQFEDVVKREGILSSPAHIEFIEFESVPSQTKNGNGDVRDVADNGLRGFQVSTGEKPNELSASTDSFKVLQQEIVNKVKQDIAEDDVYPSTPKSRQIDERKRGRSYWDRLMRVRRSYVSRRTPKYKLARKKAQLLRSRMTNLLTPSSESDESTSPEYKSGKRRRVNPNYNRNASGVSSEDSSMFLYENCRPQSESSSMPGESSFRDSKVENVKVQHSEQFQIPVVEPSRRRIPPKGKLEYHALDEISEHDEDCPDEQNKYGRGQSARTYHLHRSWSSNPNLIIIVPEDRNNMVTPTERQTNVRRSYSSPNIHSLTSQPCLENESHNKPNLKGFQQEQCSLQNNGEVYYPDRSFKQQKKTTDIIHVQDKKRHRFFTDDVEISRREPTVKHFHHIKRETHYVKNANACHPNIDTTERMNGKPLAHFDPDSDQNPQQYQKHLYADRNNGSQPSHDKRGTYCNNYQRQEPQQKHRHFQKCNDPSFRGFGLNDKYHYYKPLGDATTRQPDGSKFRQGTCGPDRNQRENHVTKESHGRQNDHYPSQKNSYEKWRKEHLAHGSHPDCPCYECDSSTNRNAQTSRVHTQQFPEQDRQNRPLEDTARDVNRPNTTSDKPPPLMAHSRNGPLPPRGSQCPPPGNVRLPYCRPYQFYGPPGPFRRMPPPPVGVPLPPSLRFGMRRPPFLGMLPPYMQPQCRYPFLLPPMPQRVQRNFP